MRITNSLFSIFACIGVPPFILLVPFLFAAQFGVRYLSQAVPEVACCVHPHSLDSG
jgi:hypothetical protein